MTLGAGDLLDSYRIVAPLKNGGMARLYLARREGAAGFAKPVAIKVIHPHLARERDFIDRFIAEARLSASIVDPHVVHVEGLGEARGTLYIAMEYVHGLSLAELDRELTFANRRLSIATSTYIASRVASGLHAAHETVDASGTPLGIIHRDVSPQNVLVAFTGHVKVIDFGIAKASVVRTGTGDASLYGKLAYMAPEHARSEEIDRRADVFALGVVLWELLTRRRLFVADNDIAMLNLLATKAIESPRVHVPEIPEALEAVVMKALARDREQRWSTAGELARALADAVPEVRSMEPGDLGALLRAVAPVQLERKRALLAKVGSGDLSAPEPATTHDPEVTTRVCLRPDEALAQLTLPVPPVADAIDQSVDEAPRAESATEEEDDLLGARGHAAPRSSTRRWVALAIGLLLPAAGYGVWTAMAAPDRAIAPQPPATAMSVHPSTASAPSAPRLQDEPTAPVESAQAAAATAEPTPSGAPSTMPGERATTAATSPRQESRPAGRTRRPGREPRAAPPKSTSTAGAKLPASCRVIDGVELCH